MQMGMIAYLKLQSLLSVLCQVVDHIAKFSALGLCHSLCAMVFHILGVEFPYMRLTHECFPILFLSIVLLEIAETDRQTDRHTHTHTQTTVVKVANV